MELDIVTKSFFDQFKEQYGYTNEQESRIFEMFIIYCVVSKYIKTETISKDLLEDLNVGDGGDWGIDGIIIIVNGKIVLSNQEVDDLLQANGYVEMQMVLIQAKMTKFNAAEFGQFLDGAEFLLKGIYDDSADDFPPSNEALNRYRDLIKYIYSKSADFKGGQNPSLDLYFVTCSEYNGQGDFTAKKSKAQSNIGSLNLTSAIECNILGRQEVISYYKDIKSSIEVTIKVEQKIALPEIPEIEESYLCLIPFKEFRKMIIDEENNIISSVFYDNIRAFQGDNTVNKGMSESLRNGDVSLFSAMNNGITVIAKELKTTGSNVHLIDYQIVNGCQTSYVLQKNMDVLGIDDLMLTVKLISSKNKEVRDKIIVGNNSQTEVKREQLVALLQTQKNIEDYYNAQNKYEKLYYERRSKQYKNEGSKVPPYKVITIPFQIKAFVSMILGKPDQVRGYYGSIVEQFDKNGIKVFAPDTKPEWYYTSALACHRMNDCFDKGIIAPKYKKIKFHVLLAFRLMAQKEKQPPLNSNKVQSYCDYLCAVLCNEQRCYEAFGAAVKLIDYVLRRDPNDKDGNSKTLTDGMMKTAEQIYQRNSTKTKRTK